MFRGNDMRTLWVLVALVSVQVIQLTPLTAATLTSAQQTAMLNAHSTARQTASPTPCPSLPNVTWDTTLANVAQNYANTCTYAHNDDRTTQSSDAFRYVGENLYINTQATVNPTHAVTAWDNEKTDYTLSTDACADGRVCGHYTQLVWSSSTSVGCGSKVCQRTETTSWPWPGQYQQAVIIVCNYGPGGNFNNRVPYTSCPTPVQTSGAVSTTTATLTSGTVALPSTALVPNTPPVPNSSPQPALPSTAPVPNPPVPSSSPQPALPSTAPVPNPPVPSSSPQPALPSTAPVPKSASQPAPTPQSKQTLSPSPSTTSTGIPQSTMPPRNKSGTAGEAGSSISSNGGVIAGGIIGALLAMAIIALLAVKSGYLDGRMSCLPASIAAGNPVQPSCSAANTRTVPSRPCVKSYSLTATSSPVPEPRYSSNPAC